MSKRIVQETGEPLDYRVLARSCVTKFCKLLIAKFLRINEFIHIYQSYFIVKSDNTKKDFTLNKTKTSNKYKDNVERLYTWSKSKFILCVEFLVILFVLLNPCFSLNVYLLPLL